MAKALAVHVAKQKSEWGGLVTKTTTLRHFDRIVLSYESVFLVFINTVLKRDDSVKNSMLSALGVQVAGPAAVSGAGFVFWLEDMHGGNSADGLQAKYDAMPVAEQHRCDWLQKLSNDFLLYYMEKIIGREFMTTIMDMYSVAMDDDQDFVWQTVIDHVRQGLSSRDAFYLMCATHCLREDGSTLVQWLLFQKQVRRQCKEMKISYPNSLWVLLCIGQISPVERRELPGVKMPVTESQMQAFKLPGFEKKVQAITKKLPVFKAKEVREFTKRLLISGVSGSKVDDVGAARQKYCKSCKTRHVAGKHTSEGKKRYKEYMERKRNGGGRNQQSVNETAAVVDAGRVTRSRKRNNKCFVCDKEHFPFCKAVKGQCNVCKKRHQPFCRRKKTVESSHPVADTTDIKAKLAGLSIRKKRELAASIVANFDELFWITDLSNDAETMFEENEDSDVVTTVTTTGLLDNTMGDVIGDEDTANTSIDTSIEDEDMNDDDVGHDHVERIPAEIVDEADGDLLGCHCNARR